MDKVFFTPGIDIDPEYTEAEQVEEGVYWVIQNNLRGVIYGPASYTDCCEMTDGPNNRVIRATEA